MKEEKELMPEERLDMERLRKKMEEFYNEELPLMRKKSEYEDLVAKIEESRWRALNANIRVAEIMASQKEPEGKKKEGGEP